MKQLNKPSILAAFLVFLSAAILRFTNLSGLSSFGWDQERDIGAVHKIIYAHRPVLSGPVAGGEGGFLLGPLYYYITSPIVILFGGQAIGLSVTSVTIDLITIVALYLVVSRIYTKRIAISSSLIWAFSKFIITNSHTSWNVSLIPLWVIAASYAMHRVKHSKNPKLFITLGVLFGLSFHIHTTVIPIIPLWLLINQARLRKISRKIILQSLGALLIGLSPLIIFDLRHNFINLSLLRNFFLSSPNLESERYIVVAQEIITKSSSTISRLIFGGPYQLIGVSLLLLFLALPIIMARFALKKEFFFLTIFTLTALLFHRDPYFPEYYLNLLLVPFVIVFSSYLDALIKHSNHFTKFFYILLILAILHSNISRYDFSDIPHSLKIQNQVASRIYQFSNSVDIRMEMPHGVGAGLIYTITHSGVELFEDSPHKIIVTESDQQSGLVSGADFVFTQVIGGYKITAFVVK